MLNKKSSLSTLLISVLSTLLISNAFTLNNGINIKEKRISLKNYKVSPLQLASNVEDEVAALKAAAAQAREDAQALAKEMGKEIDFSSNQKQAAAVTAARAKKVELSIEELAKITNSIDFTSFSEQANRLDELVENGEFSVWKSAVRSTSTSQNPLRTYPVSLNFLESRTNGKLTPDSLSVASEADVNLGDFQKATIGVVGGSTILAIASLALLPENVGATLCYIFALIPVLFLGIGSSAPGLIAGVIGSAKGTADDKEQRADRICRHEAAHFLCGYVCGLPVKDYTILDDTGFPCVEFYPSTTTASTNNEFGQEEIAALSVVSMSGSVAEALSFGQAKGGENDMIQLESYFRRSKEFLGAQKQQDLTRWGALVAYNLLQANSAAYEKLVLAFKDKKSVAECIQIIEAEAV